MQQPKRTAAWLALFLFLVAAAAIVITPAWFIQPFKFQTTRIISSSYLMRSWSPVVTVVCAIAVVCLSINLWRHSRRWFGKALLLPLIAISLLLVWLARQNHFEWMFKPLPNPNFTIVEDTDFVAPDDRVIAVEMNDEAVAYPIRQIAYHHIVQDEVGGVPVAATY